MEPRQSGRSSPGRPFHVGAGFRIAGPEIADDIVHGDAGQLPVVFRRVRIHGLTERGGGIYGKLGNVHGKIGEAKPVAAAGEARRAERVQVAHGQLRGERLKRLAVLEQRTGHLFLELLDLKRRRLGRVGGEGGAFRRGLPCAAAIKGDMQDGASAAVSADTGKQLRLIAGAAEQRAGRAGILRKQALCADAPCIG